jgi:hypothetical protein
MQSTRKLAMFACVAVAALACPAPSAGSQNRQAHRGDPSVRLSLSAHRAASGPALKLTMDEGQLVDGDDVKSFANTGSARLTAAVVTRAGGMATRTAGRYDGWAASLPEFSSSSPHPRAAVAVTNNGHRYDALSPARRPFRFGAEFWLDDPSDGSSVDNGDNLMQRGQYHSKTQYKLQVDHRVVSCRVKGAKGKLIVRSSKVDPLTWYRVRCSRTGGKLALKVWKLTDDGPDLFSSATRHGHTGSVKMARTVPLSIGGKLKNNGKIPAAGNDQFNGIVDEVNYDVGG